MEIGRLDELIERLAEDGRGVTVRPVRTGTPRGGFGTTGSYAFDGSEVWYITFAHGDELAVGGTLAEAVEAALVAIDAD